MGRREGRIGARQMKYVAGAFVALVAVLIVASVVWFKLVELPALHY